MKTHTKLITVLLLVQFYFNTSSVAQSYSYRGMYVYTLDSILNDATGKTQDVLLRYCRDSSINALTLSVGVFNLNTTPSYVTKLANFIKKARTRYGVQYFSAVFSDYTTLLNEIHFYQNSRTDSLEKFNYYNYEYEYWNNNFYTATGTGETDYCTKYLQPGGYSCDSVGAWNYFKKYIKRVDSLALADGIKSSLYIGVKSKDTLKNRFIANTVDLIMIASYKSSPSDLFQTHTASKFTAFSKANRKVDVIPIFASLTQSASENLKQWLKVPPTGKHSEASAMPIFMSEYNLLPSAVRNNIRIIGYKWFKYGGMPKDSSFTQITVTPTGLAANPNTSGAAITWNSISNATQYSVWYAPANTFAWTKINVNSNSGTLSGLNADSPYQFLVFAKTPSGNTTSSQLFYFTTLAGTGSCSMATGLTTSATTSTSTTANWIAVSGATSFNLRYRAIATASWSVLSSTSTSVNISNLTPATNYEFQIQTICSNGLNSEYSGPANFITNSIVCLPPSGLVATQITSSSAILSWAQVSGAQNYVVSYRNAASLNWTTQTTSINSCNLSGLSAGTVYEYQVQSICSATNSSSFSSIFSFTTVNSFCNAPSNLSATAISINGANITWLAVAGSASYLLHYRIKGTSIWTTLSSNGTNLQLTNLLPSSLYECAVQSICSTNNSSALSMLIEFSTLSNCASPSGITTSAITSSTATLNWQHASNALSYKVEYKIATTSNWIVLNATGISQNLNSLTPASTYSYRLQTLCSNSSSTYTNAVQFNTPAGTNACGIPSNLLVSSVGSTSVKLNWNIVNGASSYKVQYRKLGNTSWTSKTTSNSYKTITSLKASTEYEFQVQSICSSNSSSSFSVSFTFKTNASSAKTATYASALRTAQNITLKWNTEKENQALSYLIQKSEDGVHYSDLETIVISADNQEITDFEVHDNLVSSFHQQDTIWYKILEMDVEGNTNLVHATLVPPISEFAEDLKVYPNPNSGEKINLNIQLSEKQELLVVLVDIYGNTVYSKVILTDDNGTVATAINPSQELKAGIYHVIGYSSDKVLSKKLVIQ